MELFSASPAFYRSCISITGCLECLRSLRNLILIRQTNDESTSSRITLDFEMNPTSRKTIARMLTMLMLMTPLTGMAMQWSAQSLDMNHCDDMQMMQNGHGQTVQQHCKMSTDSNELCNSADHCSNTSISILNGFDPAINSDAGRIFFSSGQSFEFSFFLSELFRPPRA